ncbi:hypothetical protein LEP1GSC133_3254 [Leptospira borgpetersenii serovar Pomona str. 200901868]|uniref:Uncharacterized protein n=1 Tax=Leptospira borgpetersenii serovar Pomona str. 200901868 TaxID=1192866 RepID=M6VXI9_LEPBO|nr:hypothetical protein LEP1GSC133_3254 [Leptospira borgpetersenii serovar Pomona str. 200901868]
MERLKREIARYPRGYWIKACGMELYPMPTDCGRGEYGVEGQNVSS